MDDDTVITPYSDIEKSKKQMKKLSEKGKASEPDLIQSMDHLTRSIGGMLELFKTAAEEMKLEEREEHALSEHIKPLMEKIDQIIDQNQTIAEGMVALSDLVKERIPEKNEDLDSNDSPDIPPSGISSQNKRPDNPFDSFNSPSFGPKPGQGSQGMSAPRSQNSPGQASESMPPPPGRPGPGNMPPPPGDQGSIPPPPDFGSPDKAPAPKKKGFFKK